MSGPLRFRPNQELGQGREFDTIRALMARWGDLVADIGDDAAVLPPVRGVHVVSTDACVEGVHFLRHWLSPREVGVRAAAAALSDLAAMGAEAGQVLVAFVVPETWDAILLEVADGLASPIRAAGARIVGGNLSRGAAFGITLTVLGDAAQPVPRSGARPGDLVLVTGTLGGPGAALASWRAGHEPSAWARSRFAAPVPRLHEGLRLAQAGVTAMLDLSDGLAADARHLGAASGVSLQLDVTRLPLGAGITADAAMQSGEEYELLATLPPVAWPALRDAWPSHSDVPLTVIGSVGTAATSSPNVAGGHDHFAPSST